MGTPNEPATPVEQPTGTHFVFGPPPAAQPALAAEIDPNNPPWGIVASLLTWFGSVALLYGIQIIVIVPYAILRAGSPESLLNDKTLILLSVLSVLPAHVLTLGMAWAVVTHFNKRPFWRTLGWGWGRRFGFWISAGLSILLFLFSLLLANLFGPVETQLQQILESSRATAYAVAFIAFATAPLIEEVIYRGVLYAGLQKAFGRNWTIIGVMALFTLVHVPQYWPNFGAITAIAFLSFVLTLVRAYTGRLLPCFVIHLIFNGIGSLLILLGPYLPRSLTGQEQQASVIISHAVRQFF